MDQTDFSDSARKQITPAELGALLVNVAWAQSEKEAAAVEELATHLGVDLLHLQQELVFLRAFAVELTLATVLGPGEEKEEVLAYYYRNWERLANEGAILEELRQRLDYYGQVIDGEQRHPRGLGGSVGIAFARLGPEEATEGLGALGESMFGGVFAELTELFDGVEIVLLS